MELPTTGMMPAPSVGGITLDVPATMTVGEPSELTVTNAYPGETVYFVRSRNGLGNGPCFNLIGGGCMDIQAPVAIIGRVMADAEGTATLTLVPRPRHLGANLALQAVVVHALDGIDSVLSEAAATVVTVPDDDGDGITNALDNCALQSNPIQEDGDGDGIGDVCDNCASEPNPDQADGDGDGYGDLCQPDVFEPDPNCTPDTFTVPAGVTELQVKLWGAGGGGGGDPLASSVVGVGGAGGYASGRVPVTPGETLSIIVGGPGIYGVAGGCGGGGSGGGHGGVYVGSGGGRSAIRRGSVELITAGGGGGGGGENGNAKDGGAGGGSVGEPATGQCTGQGGTQSAGGIGGACNHTHGQTGLALQGGGGNYCGGGGGGGWFGGGAGNHQVPAVYCGAGGGGSGYLGATVLDGVLLGGTGLTPGGATDPAYTSGVGVGGAHMSSGGAGQVLISY